MTNKEIIELYIKEVVEPELPGVKVKLKKESKILRLVRPIVELFNKSFWTNYITTLGKTIYVPEGWLENGDIKDKMLTISHEIIHVKQGQKQPLLVHEILYLFPQILSIFSLLAVLAIPLSANWAWALLFLIFLAPIPAPFRYKKELEAYMTTFAFNRDIYGNSEALFLWAQRKIVKQLSKSDYYWTWPFENKIKKDIKKAMDQIDKKQYQDAITFLKRNNLA